MLSSAKMEHSQVRDCGRSLMKVRNNTGPRTVPCGMPDFGDRHDDLNPLRPAGSDPRVSDGLA